MKDFTSKCTYLKDTQFIYSLEQRSEGDDPVEGLHVHILFEKGKNAPTKLQRAFTNKFFDKYVGTHAALDFKYINNKNYNDKIKYIMGYKETSKMTKVYKDIAIQKGYNIPVYYHQGFQNNIDEIIKNNELPSMPSDTGKAKAKPAPAIKVNVKAKVKPAADNVNTLKSYYKLNGICKEIKQEGLQEALHSKSSCT